MVSILGRGQGIEPIRSQRNFELVIRQLRALFESGRLKPGEKLPAEPDLASRFGVSRTALREALKVLELSGYLEVRRGYGGGTFVARPAAEEFRTIGPAQIPIADVTAGQLAQVRRAIEPHAAVIAAGVEYREVRALEDAVHDMEVFDDRPARVLEANVDFHVGVARISANPVFVALLEGLRHAVYRDLNLPVRDAGWRARCREEHQRIIAGIRDGDREAVERTMRDHLERENGMARLGKGD